MVELPSGGVFKSHMAPAEPRAMRPGRCAKFTSIVRLRFFGGRPPASKKKRPPARGAAGGRGGLVRKELSDRAVNRATRMATLILADLTFLKRAARESD
jgi:hypothetical protein